jgi:orotidine-5'-phosphate decarboxylase
MTSRREPPPFVVTLDAARAQNSSRLCVGLDPDPAMLPAGFNGAAGIARFCREIITATADLVCAYKPNLAFFERWGAEGLEALTAVIAAVPREIPVIADAKRGDIGSTSRAHAEAIYEQLGAAACTVSPYLGADAVAPLLDHPAGYAFLLCRTSNPGAGALQDLLVGDAPLYASVLRVFAPWLEADRAGVVIGAREAAAFGWAARLAPTVQILVPGIGAQGGTVEELANAVTPSQAARVIVNAGRSIIHCDAGPDFAAAARCAARDLRDQLESVLARVGERRGHGAV